MQQIAYAAIKLPSRAPDHRRRAVRAGPDRAQARPRRPAALARDLALVVAALALGALVLAALVRCC
ncbi:MAG: hypothetical protein HS111_30130 [Kofleriaceae bacterium]|nr:hypothetical protein [Kofleriaceae bacterium]